MLRWVVRLRGPETANQTAVTVRHCVYCFGSNGKKIDVHVFNTVTLIWRKLTPVTPGRGERHIEVPSMRCRYTAVLVEDTVLIWGGYWGDEYYNVLYAFDVDTHRWFKPQVSGTVPEGKYNHCVCVLGKVMFIHGGWNQMRRTNDTHKLETSLMVWTLINARGAPPPASSWHSATSIGTKMFVFGGWNGNHYYTTRVFDTENNHWLDTPSTQLHPGERCGHSAFAYNGELYICGGWNDNDTALWKFSPETFSWNMVKPKGKGPCLKYSYSSKRECCCLMGDRVIVFGGNTRDLYILDLNPSLETLCKLAVIQHDLEQSELPHHIRCELAAMTPITPN